MQIWKTNARWFQLFRLSGDKFYNERGQILASQNKDNIIVRGDGNGECTRWDIKWVDQMLKYQKGEFHPEYGMYCQRDFYIQSWGNKYIDVLNNRNMVVKTPNGRNTQVWQFNCNYMTIENRRYPMQINNKGNSNQMIVINNSNANKWWWRDFKYVNGQFINSQNGKAIDATSNNNEAT
jgi:hypothetical protein